MKLWHATRRYKSYDWLCCLRDPHLALIPNPSVFKDRIFLGRGWGGILLWFPRHCCSGEPHPIPLSTERCKTPLFPTEPPSTPPALDDNTPTGQLCILPWCSRWSVNDPPSLIRGGGALDLLLICQCWLFLFFFFLYFFDTFTRSQS